MPPPAQRHRMKPRPITDVEKEDNLAWNCHGFASRRVRQELHGYLYRLILHPA